MIHGTFAIGGVQEESVCRSSDDYRFTELGLYRIHSTSLMPNIPFERALIQSKEIDDSRIINDEETKPKFKKTIKCQNFLTTRYVGRAPLEWYSAGQKTKMGRKFILICRHGKVTPDYRIFGTEAAIRGYNKDANDNIQLPGGGISDTEESGSLDPF